MNMTCQEAAKWLEQQEDLLILTHRRPDGDTVGCAVALCLSLRKLGKTAYILTNEDATALFDSYWGDTLAPAGFEPKAVVSVDIASEGLFHKSAEIYKCQVDLAIDHHGSNEGFAQYNCVEPEKAACGEILYTIITEWFPVDADIALPLYLAISTDTGCFVYSNTTPNTHRVAAALMETGIDYAGVNKRHFRTKSRRRIALEAELMGGAAFFHEGRGVFLAVPLEMLARTGAVEDDLEDISSLALNIEGVDCGAVLRELTPGEWKLSLRTSDNGRVNATTACQLLGGGGHAMAAGATVRGTLEQVESRVLAAVDQVKTE